MRLDIWIESDPEEVVPFDHQPALTGVVNKWLGRNNEWHGKSALYSFSLLGGGKAIKEWHGLTYPRGATLSISAYAPTLIRLIVEGIRREPEMFYGLVAREVNIIEDPDLSDREIFYPASPILLKERVEGSGRTRHVVYTEEDASSLLTAKFLAKLRSVGLEDPTACLTFAPEEGDHQTMLITYRTIKNRLSWCPVRIEGSPETKLLAWNSGLGNSTGIGFGAIK